MYSFSLNCVTQVTNFVLRKNNFALKRKQMRTEFWWKNPKERDGFEDLKTWGVRY